MSFGIDKNTLAGIIQLAPSLSKISAERICTELLKLITSDHPEALKTAYTCGITKVILPEFDAMMDTPQNNPHHCYSVGEHTLKGMCEVEADKVLRLTMLLHDMGKPSCHTTDLEGIDHFKGHNLVSAEMARKILRRLRLDNETIRKVTVLVKYHDWRLRPDEREVRHGMHQVGVELFPMLLKVQRADALAQSPQYMDQKKERIAGVEQVYENILQSGQCVMLKDLKITGQDILDLGCKPGPRVGELLQEALEEVLDAPEKNNREYLINLIKKSAR